MNRLPCSASHYVGYVEDEESIDAIMKKFQELERLQCELQTTPTPTLSNSEASVVPTDDDTSIASTPVADQGSVNESGLTQAQLEELFIRTSSFSLTNALRNDYDDIDAVIGEEFAEDELEKENEYEEE